MKTGKHLGKKSKKVSIVFFIRIILFVIAVLCVINITKWVCENQKNKNILSDINKNVKLENTLDIQGIEVEKYSVDFRNLKDKNQDIVGWIKVKGTAIEYPVVKGADNSFYLTHSLDKSYNSAGWIFADYKNKLDGNDKNIVIYGHNRRDGTMFGSLQNVLKEEWYDNKENQYITFEKENETEIYQVFSVYQIEVEDYYIKTSFDTEGKFEEFINTIKSRSINNFETDVKTDDNILTLSTCANNNKYRVVLHAKKVNN